MKVWKVDFLTMDYEEASETVAYGMRDEWDGIYL